jgi:hypothetical protein
MRAMYTKVRARSANDGSGTAGWALAAPVPACFLMEGVVMIDTSWNLRSLIEVVRSVAGHGRLSPRCGARRVQSSRERGKERRGTVPAQLIHIVEERDVGPKRGKSAKE